MKQIEATPESVWAILQENAKQLEKLSEQQAENDRQLQETERIMNASKAEVEQAIKNLVEQQTETTNSVKNLSKEMKGIGMSNGYFAEDYFINAFENGRRTFLGENFDRIEKNLKIRAGFTGKIDAEYDIVLINGKYVSIIEVKYRAYEDYIDKIIKKAVTFRENFPAFANHKIYLCIAALSYPNDVEQKFIDNGIAVIKQVGDTVVINDENLKVF